MLVVQCVQSLHPGRCGGSDDRNQPNCDVCGEPYKVLSICVWNAMECFILGKAPNLFMETDSCSIDAPWRPQSDFGDPKSFSRFQRRMTQTCRIDHCASSIIQRKQHKIKISTVNIEQLHEHVLYIGSNSPVGKVVLLPLVILAPTSAEISGSCDGFWLKFCSSMGFRPKS